MSAQILSSDLNNLIADSKRKLPDLRHAAEKSLSDLKALPATSEAQLSADLSRRSHFIEPFLTACNSKNAKFAATGVNSLQRLAVLGGLPKARLKEILDAIRECSSLSQDVQLKVLQTLPSILQNYSGEVRGGLLFSLLQTCSVLQSSKTVTVSSTAAATFQQILSALFEQLQREDAKSLEIPTSAEATGLNGPVQVRPVAFDAFRVFQDLCLLAEGKKTLTVRFSALSDISCLELVEAVLSNYSELVSTHPELAYVVKTNLLPYLISSFKEKRTFPVTVRVSRLLYMIIRSHNHLFPEESGLVLENFNQVLDQSEAQAGWKRVICLEIYRGIFMEPQLVLQLFSICDEQSDGKPIIKSCTASFVRLASEKPALLGLSQQSTVPIGNYFQRETGSDGPAESTSATINAEGTAGVASSAVPGISTQWSSVRSPFIDQLDKTDAPSMPETYVYSLVLLCLNNLADSLAKFVLPLTVQHSGKNKKRAKQKPAEFDDNEPSALEPSSEMNIKRTASLKRRNVPVNPLSLKTHPAYSSIRTAAALVDQCWPAILASCSTFFYAALDSDHYRALVRSFQKFAQVAGLLRMPTPRDAFLTTLGKAAVPAHVIVATYATPTSAVAQSPSILRSATGLLNVENLVNQASTLLPDRGRRASLDGTDNNLSSRNLLCLRALLNLAIALGPTLEASWSIIFETLQQADKIMATVNLRPMSRESRPGTQASSQGSGEPVPTQLNVMASEVSAIQAAASRLFESTSDFPNDSFVHLLRALCAFVDSRAIANDTKSPPPTPGGQHRRVSSFAGVSTKIDTAEKDFVFALSKIRELVSANVERFVSFAPSESGWNLFTTTITAVAVQSSNPSTARFLATELLSRLSRDIVGVVGDSTPEMQNEIQLRALSALASACEELDERIAEPGVADDTSNELHAIMLETLRAIVEQVGDSLTDGWRIVFDIICTAFASQAQDSEDNDVEDKTSDPTLKNVALGRSAFASTQLICSDFLASVPDTSLLTLINTIHRFASQTLDLNMSLTATTLFWNVSDLLYSRLTMESLDEFAADTANHKASKDAMPMPALWALLLGRIRNTAADVREEVRTSAISTLVRIFENHGDDLSADAWQFAFQTILLPSLQTDAQSFTEGGQTTDPAETKGRVTTSKLLLEGMAKLLITYMDTIVACSQFAQIWTNFTVALTNYLSHGQLDLDQAVFDTLTNILRAIEKPSVVGTQALQQTAQIWAEYSPATDMSSLSGSNQEAYQSYVRALREIYRLSSEAVTTDVIEGITHNLQNIIETSDASAYTSDTDTMTRLQKDVLDTTAILRTDIDGAPSAILKLYATIIALPCADQRVTQKSRRPTYIAIAKSSMDLACSFVAEHVSRREMYREALLQLFRALETPIGLKYSWSKQGKTPLLWQKATTSALTLLELTVPRLDDMSTKNEVILQYWETIVAIGKGIASADTDKAADDEPIFDHEDFDVSALSTFNKIIIPALGAERVSDEIKRTYTRALFNNSIIHSPEPDELPDLDTAPLTDLYNIRFGRTYNPEPCLRGSMAYHCLGDLISLVSGQDSSPERVKLAQAAAPYLILRAATTLRLYIADHPLRGRYMPLPSSQREELLFVLRNVRELDSEPKAIPETKGLKTQAKRHLVHLYPLVVKAVEVEGRRARPDEELLLEMRTVLEAIGSEFLH